MFAQPLILFAFHAELGHAVFPAIYRDMKEPKHYPKMVNITYAVTATIYMIMACCGYLMFGRETKEEVGVDACIFKNLFVSWLSFCINIFKMKLFRLLKTLWQLPVITKSLTKSLSG